MRDNLFIDGKLVTSPNTDIDDDDKEGSPGGVIKCRTWNVNGDLENKLCDYTFQSCLFDYDIYVISMLDYRTLDYFSQWF